MVNERFFSFWIWLASLVYDYISPPFTTKLYYAVLNYTKPIFMYLCMMFMNVYDYLSSFLMQTCKFSCAAWFWVGRLLDLRCVFSHSKSNQCWTVLKNRPAQEARVCGLRHDTRIANKCHTRARIFIWHPYFLDGTLSERCHLSFFYHVVAPATSLWTMVCLSLEV